MYLINYGASCITTQNLLPSFVMNQVFRIRTTCEKVHCTADLSRNFLCGTLRNRKIGPAVFFANRFVAGTHVSVTFKCSAYFLDG